MIVLRYIAALTRVARYARALAGLVLALELSAAPGIAQNLSPQPSQPPHVVTFAEARDLALKQASAYTAAENDVRIAEEDVHQARIGFLPSVSAPLSYIYSSPLHGPDQIGIPYTERPPAFIANNAVNEYFLVASVSGLIDINGKQRAELDRTRAELARARANALIARRGLVSAVAESYYGLSFARAARDVAKQAVDSARLFSETTKIGRAHV